MGEKAPPFSAERNKELAKQGKIGRRGMPTKVLRAEDVRQDILQVVKRAAKALSGYLCADWESPKGDFRGALKGLKPEAALRLRLEAIKVAGRYFLPAGVLINKYSQYEKDEHGRKREPSAMEDTLNALFEHGGEMWLKSKGVGKAPKLPFEGEGERRVIGEGTVRIPHVGESFEGAKEIECLAEEIEEDDGD